MVSRWGRILGLSGVCTRMAAQHVCAWKEQEFPLSLRSHQEEWPWAPARKIYFAAWKSNPFVGGGTPARERARGMLLKRVWARAVFISRPPGLNYKNIDLRPTFEDASGASALERNERTPGRRQKDPCLFSRVCVCHDGAHALCETDPVSVLCVFN